MGFIMRSQPALLGIETQKAQLKMTSNATNTLRLKTTSPKMKFRTIKGKLTIDSSQCYAEAGLRNNSQFASYVTSLSRQKFLENLGKIVDEGYQMSEFYKGNTIPEIAKQQYASLRQHEFGLTMIPKSRPVINYERSRVEYDFAPGKVENNTQSSGMVNIEYQPYKINIFMKQYNKLDITYEPDKRYV